MYRHGWTFSSNSWQKSELVYFPKYRTIHLSKAEKKCWNKMGSSQGGNTDARIVIHREKSQFPHFCCLIPNVWLCWCQCSLPRLVFQDIFGELVQKRTWRTTNRVNRREHPEWRIRLSIKLTDEPAQSCRGKKSRPHQYSSSTIAQKERLVCVTV